MSIDQPQTATATALRAPDGGPSAPSPASGVDDGHLVSGEAVELEIRVARAGSRVLALLIDIVVELVLFLVLWVIALLVFAGAWGAGLADGALLGAENLVVLMIVVIGYPVLFETVTRGRTLGKLALGLRVVRDDGGPIRFRHALTRGLVSVAVEWPGLVMPLVTWAASLTTMLANPRGKRLGDLAAGTIVIHDRTPATWGWVPAMPPQLAGWARTLDLTGLDDGLALAVRHFLARNRHITEPFRSRLGYSLAADVAARTTPQPPPGVPGWMYLAAVIAERHRRAAHLLTAARFAAAPVWPGLAAPALPVAPTLPVAPGVHLASGMPKAPPVPMMDGRPIPMVVIPTVPQPVTTVRPGTPPPR